MNTFPQKIQDFAATFSEIQQHRHDADYNPARTFTLQTAIAITDRAESAVQDFLAVPPQHQHAFVVWVSTPARK
ncbi:MAG: hypothetical protein OXF88_17835 [Rhodobacteraceae bacterium]|nr:hypothetical protein [Paracoccaceae bacterium]MCY4137963.1 hypothetical protein [Paracoccaceae bacterium]